MDCKTHMHIGSPAGQILNLSVSQMEEQLWLGICKTSGELLGSTECRALLKTHSPLQTATQTSPFSKVSCGSGKHGSFGAEGNRAGDKLGAAIPWRQHQTDPGRAVSFTDQTSSPWEQRGINRNSHCSERPSQQNTERIQWWEKINSFISVQHPSVVQDKPLAAGETLHP